MNIALIDEDGSRFPNLAADNLTDYYEQLTEMGVEIDEAAYFLALKDSVAYMLLSRCGVEAGGLSLPPCTCVYRGTTTKPTPTSLRACRGPRSRAKATASRTSGPI